MDKKFINAISYFSILFAPAILPIIIWIFGNSMDVKANAKKAFWLQVIPTIFGIMALILIGVIGLSTNNESTVGWLFLLFFGIFGLISVVTYIYDLVLGVKAILS